MLALAACASLSAQPIDGTWASNANSNWGATGTWVEGVVPGGVGSVITINRTAMSATRTLTLNNGERTVGQIIGVGTATNSDARSVIVNATTNRLVFDNGGAAARITNEDAGHLTVSGTIALMGNLELTNNNTRSIADGNYLTLGGAAGGTISAGSAGLKTIYTMPTTHSSGDLNAQRIVFQNVTISDGDGQIAIVHNSGNNLNFLSVTNNATGGLLLNSGVLRLSRDSNDNAFQAFDTSLGAAGAPFSFNGGVLNLAAGSAVLESSNRLTTLDAGGGTFATAASSSIIWNGSVVGSGALTVAGNVTLTQDNSYSGGTAVNGGTLVAAHNSSLGTGAVTVNAGTLSLASGVSLANNIRLDFDGKLTSTTSATLLGRVSGIGTIGSEAGALNFAAGSVLAPGGELPGILNVEGEVMLQAGSVFQWQLAALSEAAAGQSFSQIVIAEGGYLNIANGAMLDLVFGNGLAPHGGDAFWSENHSWLIVAGNNVSNGLFDIDNSAWSDVGWFYTTLVDGGVALNWTAAAIPEPSTYAAIFGGLALIGVVIKRRAAAKREGRA